jgi:hypothetical protein
MIKEKRFSYILDFLTKSDKDKVFRALWENSKIYGACISGFLLALGIRLVADGHSYSQKTNAILFFFFIFAIFYVLLSGKYLLDIVFGQKIIANSYIMNTGLIKQKKSGSVLYINTEVKADKILTIPIPYAYITLPVQEGSKIEISVSKHAEVLLDFKIL